MILRKTDWPRLLWPFFVLILAAVLSFALPFMSHRVLDRMILEESAAQKALFDADERITEAKRARQSMATYMAAYQDLQRRGVFEEFKRIDLLEEISDAGNALFSMTYSISPQQKIKSSYPFVLDANRVQLDLGLLHEGRLIDFFDSIRTRTKGIPLAEGCDLERIEGGGELAYEPHLEAKCTVVWITLEDLK